jgi:hypothetical protein
MARKTILTVAVLIILLGLLYWFQQSRENDDVSADTDLTISVFNQTKNADGTAVAASPKDVLVYTLTVNNTSDDVISGYVVETNIEDISELATLTDAQGANYNAATNSLTWTPLDVPAESSIEKQFTVAVKENLPADSDLIMTASFGDEVAVTVNKSAVANNPGPTPTPAPRDPYKAPTSGPSAWFAFLLAITFTAGVVIYKTAKRINA